ncbi:MAG: polysaccharide biosynthesis C-terminal domain-containing protein [Haliscomenobacter sp.]|nr:polysaccharide biosynthesis C-terminal domain-containing protein [Haliscomenobacter sp.]MBP9076513.1 polysaccharide biosynthesis C-terminal domain-containing protein [Haliscomenobacter sp.]MBP9873723.1 polysaccharide biosynthesis C-terminal domain-containing protein [Haliscomenobacter sp.]
MGIIIRQGIKRSIIQFLGVGIGAASTLFIYPLALETYGLAQFLLNTAAFFVPFATLGINALTVRFFPAFKDEQHGHNGFLGFLLGGGLAFFILFIALAWLFRTPFYSFIQWMEFDQELFINNLGYVLAIGFFLVFSGILESWSSNFGRVAIPYIFSNLVQKIGLPVLLLLCYWGTLSLGQFKMSLAGLGFVSLLGLLWYAGSLGQIRLKIRPSMYSPRLLKQMSSYALYGILTSVGALLAFRIDSIMVASMINVKSNGVYNIALFMANAIEIPYLAIAAISAPLIANAFQQGDREHIMSIYRKASLNLLIAGLFVFMGLWICVEDLFRITPRYDELIAGKQVVFFLGIAKVVGMVIGMNNLIIDLSRYYRFNLVSLLLLAGSNIALNYWLIPQFGITGAAMATALSITGYNLVNFMFTLVVLKMQPFSRSTLMVLAFAGISYGAAYWLPETGSPILNILIKGAVLVITFAGPIVYFRISEDIHFILTNFLKKTAIPGPFHKDRNVH